MIYIVCLVQENEIDNDTRHLGIDSLSSFV